MKRRFWMLTILMALPLASGCLQIPDKLPNPDSLTDVAGDAPEEVVDAIGDADAVDALDAVHDADAAEVGDTGRDIDVDAADVPETDADTVEPCIEDDQCDDGNPCTVNDVCDALGQCIGTLVAACDDGLECTDDSCTATDSCDHVVKAGFCKVNGVCYAADAVDLENWGPCNACKPAVSQIQMSPDDTLSCDDGTVCTTDDHCASGSCASTALVCNDTNACTDDSCDKVDGCRHSNNTNECAPQRCVGLMNYKAAVCADGACPTVTPENCDDGNPCTSDFCKSSGCSHTVKNGQMCKAGSCDMGTWYAPAYCINDVCPEQDSTFCDDGNICTTDVCSPDSGCTTIADNTKVCGQAGCNGKIYTPAVTCFNKSCPAAITRNCDDGNICTDDVCTLAGCQNNENEAPCTDGNPCTLGDQCKGKACDPGDIRDCSDGLYCTTDLCDIGSGECTHNHAGYCLIDDTCYSDSEVNPVNMCEQCQAYIEPEQWYPAFNGMTCNDYAFGTAKCSTGECLFECNDNRGDCDGIVDNGCESNLLNDPHYCGDCLTDCGTQVCSWGTCADTCAGDLELCNGRCEDTTTSLEHCGGCNRPCEFDNANASCSIGICSMTNCKDGYYNVNLILDDGCECHSTGLELCDDLDNDCNGMTDDVAVEMLATDPANCGSCGKVCNGGDRTVYGVCSGGNCYEVPCGSNTWDNDKSPLNGCEYFCVYAGSEACGNGIDDDCNGSTDEGC